MKPPGRWPLHPAPIDGEALSSWLRRLAAEYQMDVSQLIQHGLGIDPGAEQALDLNPPHLLLDTLAERTGITRDRLAHMHLAGSTPWLLDSVQPDPAGFATYVRQFSVLLTPGTRSKHSARSWVAWMPHHPVQRACRECMQDPDRQGLLMIWLLPLTLSCPDHELILEPCIGIPGDHLTWISDATAARTASDAVLAMDRRTQQALSAGHVELPARRIHAGVWFRVLRTILHELSTPVTYWKPRATDLQLIWDSSGHPVRARQSWWRTFEAFPWPIQTQLLQAAAEAIRLLEDGTVRGRGTHAELFFPVHEPVDDGHPQPAKPKNAYLRWWDQVNASLDHAIQTARDDPAEAQALYDFLASPSRYPAIKRAGSGHPRRAWHPNRRPVTQIRRGTVCMT